MSCQDNYIGINRSAASRSGLYASDLPGVEDLVFTLLSKGTETTIADVWGRVYSNAWNNTINDLQQALQKKFHVDRKLLTKQTSEFTDEVNTSGALSGVKIGFTLPKYAKTHIISVDVWVEQDYLSPELTVYFYDTDENGELLHSVSQAVEIGKNTIFVDTDFEVDKIFIAVDTGLFQIKQTVNKKFNMGYLYWSIWDCRFPCFGNEGSVSQINGGGVDVKYDVYCSIEKYLCENINLFKTVLWWRVGMELIIERRYGNRLNQFTTMTQERAAELTTFYNAQYQQALMNNVESVNIHEDPYCFECNATVSTRNLLP